jgi:hypothetical protein
MSPVGFEGSWESAQSNDKVRHLLESLKRTHEA